MHSGACTPPAAALVSGQAVSRAVSTVAAAQDLASVRHFRVRTPGSTALSATEDGIVGGNLKQAQGDEAGGQRFEKSQEPALPTTGHISHPVDSASSFQTWNDEDGSNACGSPLSIPCSSNSSRWTPKLMVFSGGTAFNSVAGKLMKLTTAVSHILPVSDDGGSTAEIVRVLGGPAVGDIRSRCLRLADDSDAEARAVRRLLGYRLSSKDKAEAEKEWYEIVEGCHHLWDDVTEPYKHTIRAFLVYFYTQILRHVTQKFDFRNGSVGNFFFAGARLFFRSLDAAVFLFSRVARIPEGSQVLPAIQTEERITLGAELEDGTFIRGQSEISHPTGPKSNVIDKLDDGAPLHSPIRRVFYLSSEGTNVEHEVFLPANSAALSEFEKSDAIIYGMGSLYTSICPSLILGGMGESIASKEIPKILLVNGRHDRETSSCRSHLGPMNGSDVVEAVADALNRRYAGNRSLENPVRAYVTAILIPKGGSIPIDVQQIESLGVELIKEVPSVQDKYGQVLFEPVSLVEAIEEVINEQSHNIHM